MNNELERIRKVFNESIESGNSKTEIANKLNVTSAYIWKLLNNDKASPSEQFIKSVCREFNVNEEWLRTGEGEQYIFPIKDDYDEITTIIGSRDLKARKAIIDYWNLSDSDKELFWKFIERFIDKGEI